MKKARNEKPSVREDQIERTLHQVLREDGAIFPVSEHDIETLESELNAEDVTPIDPERLIARVHGDKEEPQKKVVPLFGEKEREVEEDLRAMAARNGKQISEQRREQMDRDRAHAEKPLRKK
jgi:hypothetical protein